MPCPCCQTGCRRLGKPAPTGLSFSGPGIWASLPFGLPRPLWRSECVPPFVARNVHLHTVCQAREKAGGSSNCRRAGAYSTRTDRAHPGESGAKPSIKGHPSLPETGPLCHQIDTMINDHPMRRLSLWFLTQGRTRGAKRPKPQHR